ncbi:MAG: pyridoxal-dependent decarboxylase, partial [Gemmatimonadota bacterium]|nr:pyridoxal-dependent decarboxylase [Gemmatimonadota bacterium]
RGIERARSIAWDPHKMMLLPLSAGMLLMRDERDLEAAFTQRAPYIFHEDGEQRTWDQGVRSFLCSRRADALKVWVALQRYGAGGIGALYEHLCDTTRILYDSIEHRDDFESMHEPESNILCFRYVGSGARNDAQLDALNLEIRTQYNASGAGWITTTALGQRRTLRATIMNPRTNAGHIHAVLDGLSRLGRRMRTGEVLDLERQEA